MPIIEVNEELVNRVGLHARPARLLVQTAAQFKSKVQVRVGEKSANARSIVSVLKLGAAMGDVLHIQADGDDAEEAVKALSELIRRKFDEKE